MPPQSVFIIGRSLEGSDLDQEVFVGPEDLNISNAICLACHPDFPSPMILRKERVIRSSVVSQPENVRIPT